MSYTLHHGDAREVLARLPDASVDACVTDPPYDLTSGTGRGFMGRAWDGTGVAFDPATWAAVFRVLKPGAHLLAFGGTRTSHRMVCAIEDAGFEIRDSLLWVYSQGFPKSLDVAKAIDKAAGAERTEGAREWRGGQRRNGILGENLGTQTLQKFDTPATPKASTWDGWGTALKPAHEPICLARKPLEGTVAANVLEHGTGAMNIDGCRVGAADLEGAKREHKGAVYEGVHDGYQRPGRSSYTHKTDWHPEPAGRYPANLLLSHVAPDADGNGGCVPVGVRRVRGSHLDHVCSKSRNLAFGHGTMHKRGHTDADGCEQVEAWDCAPGCPVAALDRQSGERPGSGRCRPSFADASDSVTGWNHGWRGERGYDDTGGASRFFPIFYAPKAAQAERKKGVGKNAHPTVKPVSLCRWLCRLITPPGGTVLDCFLGSGSIGVAALEEGFSFIGIEQDAEYIRIARGRLAAVNAHLPGLLEEA